MYYCARKIPGKDLKKRSYFCLLAGKFQISLNWRPVRIMASTVTKGTRNEVPAIERGEDACRHVDIHKQSTLQFIACYDVGNRFRSLDLIHDNLLSLQKEKFKTPRFAHAVLYTGSCTLCKETAFLP